MTKYQAWYGRCCRSTGSHNRNHSMQYGASVLDMTQTSSDNGSGEFANHCIESSPRVLSSPSLPRSVQVPLSCTRGSHFIFLLFTVAYLSKKPDIFLRGVPLWRATWMI